MTKNSKKFNYYIYFIVIFALVFLIGGITAYTTAYFTASSNASGGLNFSDISLEINSENEDGALFSADLTSVVPGDTISFDNISVNNTGDADIYSLLHLSIVISKTGQEDYTISNWYNLSGTALNVNMASNTTKATLLEKNVPEDVALTYTFEGSSFGDTFKNSNITVTLQAVGIQAENLEQVEEITDEALIAAYLLVEDYNNT